MDAYSAENNLDAGRFDVMGFSQGAALTNTITLPAPRNGFGGLEYGRLPSRKCRTTFARPTINGKIFLVAHGRWIETVNIEYARHP